MPITIMLNDKDLDKYPSLHSRMIDELEDKLADVIFKAGFIDFTLENSYTGNTIAKEGGGQTMNAAAEVREEYKQAVKELEEELDG